MGRDKIITLQSLPIQFSLAFRKIFYIIREFLDTNFTPPLCASCSKSEGNRIAFIDLAKGICILLVVFSHSNMSEYLNIPILKTLRMPLYFLLSGLFFKNYGSLYNLFEKKLNKLIVPFIFFSIIAIPLIYLNFHAITIKDLIAPITDIKGGYNLPIWFLLSLFWVNIIFGCITLFFKKIVFQGASVIVLCIAGVYLANNGIHLPLFFTQALIAMPFFLAGYILKKTPLLYDSPKYDKSLMLYSFVMLLLCVVLFSPIGTPMLDFFYLDFTGNILLAYIFSIIVVVATLLICKRIKWLPIISYIGRFSVIVLGLHWLYIKAYSMGYSYFISPDLNIPLRFIVVVVACWISIPFVLKLVPHMVAQRDLIKLPKPSETK